MRNEVTRCRHLDNVDWQFNDSCLPPVRYPMTVSILCSPNGMYTIKILREEESSKKTEEDTKYPPTTCKLCLHMVNIDRESISIVCPRYLNTSVLNYCLIMRFSQCAIYPSCFDLCSVDVCRCRSGESYFLCRSA